MIHHFTVADTVNNNNIIIIIIIKGAVYKGLQTNV